MTKKIFGALVLSFLLLFIYNCKSSSGDGSGNGVNGDDVIANPSFAQHIQPVFTNNCATSGCHNSAAGGGLVLSTGQAYGNLVNVPSTGEPNMTLVIPSDADNSYLVIKLEGRQNVGARMPLTGSISNNQIQNIKNWINNGAQNN